MLYQPPVIPEMIHVLPQKFRELFEDKDRYEERERPMWAISYYEFDIYDNYTKRIVGYYTQTSYENTYQIVYDLCTKEDLLYHYQKLMGQLELQLNFYKRPRKLVHKNSGPGLLEFLDDEYVEGIKDYMAEHGRNPVWKEIAKSTKKDHDETT